jgi:hypothetical protein
MTIPLHLRFAPVAQTLLPVRFAVDLALCRRWTAHVPPAPSFSSTLSGSLSESPIGAIRPTGMPGFPTPTNVVGVNANGRDPTNRGKARRYTKQERDGDLV